MITFTKEQLIASALARIDFAEMMLSGELEPLKERTWSIELELARIAMASLEADSNINNHPAHSPLTTRRLHQMRDILSKASEQRDGGDIGYAMSDAVRLIDEVLARRAAAFEATFPRESPEPLDGRVPIQDEETSQMRESLDARYKTMLEAAPQQEVK